jgi:hypothetical protein
LFHVRDALIPFHQIVYGFPYLLIFADKREYVYTFIGKIHRRRDGKTLAGGGK